MIEIQAGNCFKLLDTIFSVSFNHIVQEILHLIDIINEYLQQVFNSDLLILFEFIFLVEFRDESTMFVELNKGSYNVSHDTLNLFNSCLLLECRKSKSGFLLGVRLEELRSIELQTFNFLLQVTDVNINNLQSLNRVLSVLDLNLYQKLPLLAFLSKFLSLFQGLLLLTTNFNSCGYIKDCVLLILGGFLNKLGNLILLLSFDIAIEKQGSVIFVIVCK
jgi:hypothetical protein